MAEKVFEKAYIGGLDLIEPIDEYIDPMTPVINSIGKDFAIQFEGEVMRAVREVGVVIDKDRLLQALTDAKHFYEEGYINGCNSVHRHGRWTKDIFDEYCSVCGFTLYEHYRKRAFRYCPHCGTKMDGKDGAE